MNILLICDDFHHPGQIPIGGCAPLKEKGFTFDIITNANEFKPDILKNYPAVLLCKCDEVSAVDKTPWKTEMVQQAFIDYVEGGGGLLAIHTATVAGKQTETLDKLIGCKFIFHPVSCPVTVQAIKPHPVTECVGMFIETDEHYRLGILSDDVDIIAASYSPAQGSPEKYEEDNYSNTPAWISPAALVRTQGKGRVCVLTPGHLLPVWHNPDFQQMLMNALNWCGKS